MFDIVITRHIASLLAGAIMVICGAQAAATPVQGKQGEVVVLHGGVGEEDRAAMEQKAADYNLRLTFARKGSGAYLSDVRVAIRNAQGTTLLDTVSAGPWLFARLPQGDFTVSATEDGRTLTQSVSIKGASRREWVFRFDGPAMD